MTEHTAQPGTDQGAVTWRAMNAREESRLHAMLSSAVASTVRGLALVVDSSPTAPHRPAA